MLYTLLVNVAHLMLICSSIDFLQNASLSQFLPLPKAVASHADILRGLSRVPRAGTHDEPLRTSAREATKATKQFKIITISPQA